MKVVPTQYVVVTYRQKTEREGHRDVEVAGHAHKRSVKRGVGVANHHPEMISTPPKFFTRPIFTPQDPFQIYTIMNNPHNDHILKDGRRYRYDADYDCYYRVFDREDLTHAQRYGWIYVIAVLTAVCFYVEFLR